MEIEKLRVTEETETHILFYLILSFKRLWSTRKITKKIDCFKPKKSKFSHAVSDGRPLFRTFSDIDESINAILSSKNKHYENI